MKIFKSYVTEALKGLVVSKKVRPEIFDKASSVGKAKIYHVGSIHHADEIKLNINQFNDLRNCIFIKLRQTAFYD